MRNFLENLKIYSKIKEEIRDFPYSLPHTGIAIIHAPHHSGTFITTDELTLPLYNYPKSI